MNKIYSWRLRHVTVVPRLLRYTVAQRGQAIGGLRAFAAQGLQRGPYPRKGFDICPASRSAAWATRSRMGLGSRMATRRKQSPKNAPQATPEERAASNARRTRRRVPYGHSQGHPQGHP